MEHRIQQLNRYVRGWMSYFGLSETPGKFASLDQWFRRRMRQILWKQWKNPRTPVVNLRRLGMRPERAYQWGNSSRAYWRTAGSTILTRALPNEYWMSASFSSWMQGIVFNDLANRRMRGPHVRWCESRGVETRTSFRLGRFV